MLNLKIGVLALQGAVAEHLRMIKDLGEEAVAVKRVEQLDELDGIIIPGGESTTIGKLMIEYGFKDELIKFSEQKKPIFGTCAGLIILANDINDSEDKHLALLDVKVERNAFGRQRESFEADLKIDNVGEDFRAVFIRAPYIMSVEKDVEVLSVYDDKIVAVRQENLVGAAFHPELTEDTRMHKYFIDLVKKYKVNRR